MSKFQELIETTDHFNPAANVEPSISTKIFYRRGLAFFNRKRFSDALDAFSIALQIEPNNKASPEC